MNNKFNISAKDNNTCVVERIAKQTSKINHFFAFTRLKFLNYGRYN